MDLKVKEMKQNGIHYHMIPTKKFKTIHIVIKCKAVLERDTVTKRALLPYLLLQGTSALPSESDVAKKLDTLYGATLGIDGLKKGNHHIISFRLDVANEKFIHHEKTVVTEALQLLNDILFDPHLEEGIFPEKIVEREKITLANKINSIYDDKLAYANMRLIEEMCKDENYRIHAHGYTEDLPQIDGADMHAYYRSVLENDQIDMYVLGDFDAEEMGNKVRSMMTERPESKELVKMEEKTSTPQVEPKEIVEIQAVQQAKLHIGYRTHCTIKEEGYFALQVLNGLFGRFSNSKLFKQVREKHSLAYYASSRIESNIGLLIVFSGIEAENDAKVRRIIDEQMNAIKVGDFTEEEIERTKELIISEIKETLDHPLGIIELLYQQVIAEVNLTPEHYMEQIKKVTKTAMTEVASHITLDTIYVLTNQKEDEKVG